MWQPPLGGMVVALEQCGKRASRSIPPIAHMHTIDTDDAQR
jgi:hypothetical protein